MKKFLLAVALTFGFAFAIVLVGQVVLLGYETFFETLLNRRQISNEPDIPRLDMPINEPTPTPHAGEDFIFDFSGFDDEDSQSAHNEPLPDPISITPLSLLPMYTPGGLELPVVGATGWAGARIQLYSSPLIYDEDAPQRILSPGQEFVILIEWEDWWFVRLPNEDEGWVRHGACFINLPDVIPSIVYNITNARRSIKTAGDYDIPGITNIPLYSAYSFNYRFHRSMYIVPALYATAKRLFHVQQAALENGDTLVIYEVFRPHSTQQQVVRYLNDLMRVNSYVRTALNTNPWSPTWFISHGVSNHQRGAAVDATIARVKEYTIEYTADFMYSFRRITDYVHHPMPSRMHDLHPRAATFLSPGSTVFTNTMTESAKLLQSYFMQHGFSPLASEWWHFNDSQGIDLARNFYITGTFYTERILSFPPFFGS